MSLPPFYQDALDAVYATLEGWCPPDKAVRLAELVQIHQPQITVELGVYGGMSLAGLATGHLMIAGGLLIGVDPYTIAPTQEGTNDAANATWWAAVDLKKYEAMALGMLATPPFADVPSILLREHSIEAARLINAKVDLLHQDSNHSPEVSLAEIDAWGPKMRPGALWVMDDTAWATMQPVQEELRRRGWAEEEVHHNWTVWRVPR